MVRITSFMYKPHYAPDKPYLVYSVDCENPDTKSGYIQGYWKCIHCGKGNQFRIYINSKNNKHLTYCPDCKKEFIVIEDLK